MFLLLDDFTIRQGYTQNKFRSQKLNFSEFVSLIAPQYRPPFFPQTKIT
jgi:hypothetical protein